MRRKPGDVGGLTDEALLELGDACEAELTRRIVAKREARDAAEGEYSALLAKVRPVQWIAQNGDLASEAPAPLTLSKELRPSDECIAEIEALREASAASALHLDLTPPPRAEG